MVLTFFKVALWVDRYVLDRYRISVILSVRKKNHQTATKAERFTGGLSN